ncbi:hypothetical protein [Gordonia sp. NB41Y]|uniref:hypothetical protein n=1 Tax=Gordonia sp. NB41Y TaxID=875808 RepID=UPI001364DFFD|nr:hypothetical protein [Gordonia sp. NB41Y]WLP90236.1 hypothetical protein Q9K23_22425 [Gordonia sp. NB41Y]
MPEQTIMRTRTEVREKVQQLIQHHCSVRPLSIACDDDKAAALAELIIRITEGRA